MSGEQRAAKRYSAGQVICDRYRLKSVLGEGGMGTVWRAEDTSLEVDVAVKLIHHELATPETSARLLQEARAAAKLGHPSVVRVFDFGQTGQDDPFVVMELLDGELLSDFIDRKGRLSPTKAVATLLPVASALSAAHEKGIVHRDMKPDNVVLVGEPSGTRVPKVLDFGIALLRTEDASSGRRMTGAHTVLGTPEYMSPEQASGLGDIDQRTDVWALSVLLYEMVTGDVPFNRPTPMLVLVAVATVTPVPITDLGVAEPELWAIIKKGLERDVADRWSTMREFGAALARWVIARGVASDIAGTSLTAHWLNDGGELLSEAPPASQSALAMMRIPRNPMPSLVDEPSSDRSRAEMAGPSSDRTVDLGIVAAANPVAPQRRSFPWLLLIAGGVVVGGGLGVMLSLQSGVPEPTRAPAVVDAPATATPTTLATVASATIAPAIIAPATTGSAEATASAAAAQPSAVDTNAVAPTAPRTWKRPYPRSTTLGPNGLPKRPDF